MTASNDGICVFSGHRDVLPEDVDKIKDSVYSISEWANEFVVGGARGADTIALGAIVHLAETGKRFPRPVIIVPKRVADQPSEAIEMIGWAGMHCDPEIIELNCDYNAASLKYRNMVMVDRAVGKQLSRLLVYWRGIYRSGTYSAMCYAKKNLVPVQHIIKEFESK